MINARVVKRILLGRSTHLTRYKTRTNDLLALEPDSSPDVSFPRLAAANVYYGLFGELLEGPFPPPLYGFSGPCYYGLYRQLFPDELNLSAFQAAQGPDSGNGVDLNQGLQSGDEINAAAPDGVNTRAGNGADVIKRPDFRNEVVAQLDDGRDSSKRPISLDGVVGALDRADTGAGNKADVEALDRADTRGSNGVGMTMEPHFEEEIVGGVENKVDTGDSYRLDSLIPDKDHAENLPSCKLADVLANSFDDLSPTLMDFRSSLAFPVSSSYPATSDSTSV